jgi:hypothetical protein
MIVDYRLRARSNAELRSAFQAIDRVAEAADIAVEGAFATDDGRGGRAYLAVPRSASVESVMDLLDRAELPCDFTLFHPVDDD